MKSEQREADTRVHAIISRCALSNQEQAGAKKQMSLQLLFPHVVLTVMSAEYQVSVKRMLQFPCQLLTWQC